MITEGGEIPADFASESPRNRRAVSDSEPKIDQKTPEEEQEEAVPGRVN